MFDTCLLILSTLTEFSESIPALALQWQQSSAHQTFHQIEGFKSVVLVSAEEGLDRSAE